MQETRVRSLIQADPTCHRICAAPLLSLCSRGREPQLLSPRALEPGLQQEKPATAVRSPGTPAREKLPLATTKEEKPLQQRRLSAAKNKCIQLYIYMYILIMLCFEQNTYVQSFMHQNMFLKDGKVKRKFCEVQFSQTRN